MASLAAALAGHRLVALDTSIWIYHFEGSRAWGPAADAVLDAVSQGVVKAVASELVLLELLVAPLRRGALDAADDIELALVHLPHLKLAPITLSMLVHAAGLRGRHGLQTADAIMIATALSAKATLAITNDAAWKKVKDVEVLLLRELDMAR